MSDDRAEPLRTDRHIAAAIWPTLLASVAGLLPFTVFSTFLVPIAESGGSSEAAVGALRGLGGIGAAAAGVLLAPLFAARRPGRIAAWSLLLLAVASLLGAVPSLAAVAAFCLLIGISNALLYPALSTAAADRFGTGPSATRAATLVTAAKTLAATLAAPLIALPALWWGWRGDLVAVAALAVLLIPVVLRHGRTAPDPAATTTEPGGYLGAFRRLAAVPGARALVVVSFGQAGAFMGYQAYLAAFYSDRFGLAPEIFAFVWSLSGAAFFLGNLVAGRLVNAAGSHDRAGRALTGSMVVALVALFGVYLAPNLATALVSSTVLSAAHAVGVAAVVTLLVRRCGELRGPALSINASGLNLGLFFGAGAGGAGLAAGGYLGAGAVFGALTVLSLICAVTLPRDAPGPTAHPSPGPAGVPADESSPQPVPPPGTRPRPEETP